MSGIVRCHTMVQPLTHRKLHGHNVFVVFRGGRVEIIPNSDGARTMPSWVAFVQNDDGERLVGAAAKFQGEHRILRSCSGYQS